MRKLKTKQLIIAFLFSFTSLYAGEAKWSIIGQIAESETNETVPYANVALFNKLDSSLVFGCTSNFEGEFILNRIEKGEYYLELSFIGFEDFIIEEIEFSNDSKVIDLGLLQMKTSISLLGELEVSASVSPIRNTLDKQIINIDKNISINGGTAVDALKLSPSVSVTAEGNVKLRGSSQFIILINGKPTTLSADEVLRQTPANNISSIEIITSPSVKYNAEGGAGVINIVLKKNADGTFNGMVNASVGSKDKYSGDLTLNYNKDKFSLSGAIDWRDYSRISNNNYYRELFKEGETHYAFLYQDRLKKENNLSFRFGLDYNPSERDNLSYSIHTGYTQLELDINEPSSAYSSLDSIRANRANNFYLKQKPRYLTNNLFYSRKTDEKGSGISINAYYSFIDYYLLNSQIMVDADDLFNPMDTNPYLLDIINDNYSHDIRLDVDYTRSLGEQSMLETGISYHKYDRYLNVKYSEYEFESEEWIDNEDFTNEYSFKEDVYSAYANLNTVLWGINTSIGLRTEYTDRLLEGANNNDSFTYSNVNFFPGFSFSKSINNKHSIKLANSNRINRPDEYMMNPFPEFEDQFFYSVGNPFLIPEIVRSTELSYQYLGKKTTLSANLYYRSTTDKIEQQLWVREDEKVALSYHNNARDKSLGLEIMGNFELSEWWSLNASSNTYQYQIEGSVRKEAFSRNAFSWSIQLVNNFSLWKNANAQLIGYYNSKTVRSQGELSDYYFLDLALSQQLLDGKLKVNFQWKDMLQSLNYQLTTEADNMYLLGDFQNESPIFMLSIGYQISKYNKKTKDIHTDFDM